MANDPNWNLPEVPSFELTSPDFAQGGVKEAGQLGVALAQVVPLVERAVGGA